MTNTVNLSTYYRSVIIISFNIIKAETTLLVPVIAHGILSVVQLVENRRKIVKTDVSFLTNGAI